MCKILLKIEGKVGMERQKNSQNINDDLTGAVSCAACSDKTKHRDEKEYKDFLTRLNRIEGQVRGIKKMVEEERYCIDILTQVAAIQSALNSFNKVLLASHIKSCVAEEIRQGKDEVIDELCAALQKMMR